MKNKIAILLIFLAGTFVLSSCLKDEYGEYWKDDLSGKMYATIVKNTVQSLALQPVAGDVVFSFDINIATDALPTEDITLTFGVNNQAITDYNQSTGLDTTDHPFLAFPNVEVLTPTVTIAKGTRTGKVEVKVWGAETLDACDNYMTAISILSASGNVIISSNMDTYLCSLPINNPYAADYLVTGYRIRPGNATEPIPVALETFSTVNCKTVRKTGFGNYTAYDVVIEITATTMDVNGTTCYKLNAYPINPTTGLSVGEMWDTWTGDANTAPAPPADPSWINYYNPVTKTFVLNLKYYSGAGDRIMYEVCERQ